MKKIPTIFLRDFERDPSRVTAESNPECAWVFAGEGIATRKLDGTCCMVRGDRLFKRREGTEEQLLDKLLPPDFELADRDVMTGKVVGWVPVGNGPDDRWHREAFAAGPLADGTYELIGPKVQGNPENAPTHALVRHGEGRAGEISAPLTYETLAGFFSDRDIEGIVFHHPDGRMGKIKARDFGIKRQKRVA